MTTPPDERPEPADAPADAPDAAGGHSAPPATATPADESALEPEIGDRWGTFPPPKRRAELDARLAAWRARPDHGTLLGPFDMGGWGGGLTGADVYYLAARSLVGLDGDIADGLAQLPNSYRFLRDLHLEHADLSAARLEHANLRSAIRWRSWRRWRPWWGW